MSLMQELKRRRVLRAGGVYAVASVAVLQGLDVLIEALRLPAWALTVAGVVAVAGLPIVLVLAWVYEWTPSGVRRQAAVDAGDVVVRAPLPHATLAGGVGIGILVALVGMGAYARMAPAPPVGEGRSLAVLPFANLSAEPDNEYFSDGISEDILTKLATLPGLHVISRTSALRYKGTTKSLPEVARELGVTLVLQGSVRRAGNRIRITAQLTRAETDEHVWADTYDRELADVFAVQTDIAERIARELRVRVGAADRARLAGSATADAEAYDLILRGRRFLDANYRSTDELVAHAQAAIALFRQALARDPNSAQAVALLARAYGWHMGLAPDVRRDSALALAQRAVALDPQLAVARLELARAHSESPVQDSARHHLDVAIRLNPNDAEALGLRGLRRARREGDYVGGIRDLRRSIEADPGVAFRHSELASLYFSIEAYDAAERAWREAFERIAPHPARLACHLGMSALARGRADEAVRQAYRIRELQPDATFGTNCAGNILYLAGRDLDTARAWLESAHAVERGTVDDFALVVLRRRAGDSAGAERLIAIIDSVSRADRAPHSLAGDGWRVALAAYRGRHDEVAQRLHASVRERTWRNATALRLSLGDAAQHPAVAAALDSMAAATARVRAQLTAEGLQ